MEDDLDGVVGGVHEVAGAQVSEDLVGAVIPEVVIHVKPSVGERRVHLLCQSMGLSIIKPMEFTTQEYLLEVLGPDAESVFAAVEQLNEVDVIEWACSNTAMRPPCSASCVWS